MGQHRMSQERHGQVFMEKFNCEARLGRSEGLEKEYKKLCWALRRGTFTIFFHLPPVFPAELQDTEGRGWVSYNRRCDQPSARPAAGCGAGSHVALNSPAFGNSCTEN